jgi:Flp pilus assembly protein TadG
MDFPNLRSRWSVFARRFTRDDSGSAAVEFSLVAPVFITFLLAIIFGGWAAYTTNNVHHALAKSARVLQLKPTTTKEELQKYLRDNLQIGNDEAEQVTVELSFETVNSTTKLAHTTATFPLTLNLPLLGKYSIVYSTSMTVAVVSG